MKEERVVAGYARVSSTTKKDDLERQKQLLHSYAKGYGEVQILSDVGSGLNENRKGFLRLLEMVAERKVSKVTEIEVINSEELVDELDNHRVPFCRETLRGEVA